MEVNLSDNYKTIQRFLDDNDDDIRENLNRLFNRWVIYQRTQRIIGR